MTIAFVSLLGLLAPASVHSAQHFWSSAVQQLDFIGKAEGRRNLQPPFTWAPTTAPTWNDDFSDPDGFELCLELLPIFLDENPLVECFCDFNNFGVPTLTCTDYGCEICDESGESCGITSFELALGGEGFLPVMNLTASFQYVSGPREDIISFEQYECDFESNSNLPCAQCEAYLNFQRCSSCEVCEVDGLDGFVVDCENLEMESSFDYCSALQTGDLIDGPFEAVMYETTLCEGETIASNGRCANATFLSPENPSAVQTLNYGMDAEAVPFCFIDQSNSGLWYSVVGTGNVMSVSTCSQLTYYDTLVTVYQDGCDSLQCVPSAEQQQGCFDYYPGTAVSWVSEPGRLYHVLVGSRYGEVSQFEINLFEVSEASEGCSESQLLEIDGPAVSQALDSDVFEPSDDVCMQAFRAGAWYRVESPEDTVLRASTCSGITSFFTGISVMEGSECGFLACTASMRPFEYVPNCGETGAQIEWAAKSGVVYYVLVHGEFGERGIFSLSITSLNPPANDVCETAFQLEGIGSTAEGSLQDATMAGENFHYGNETDGISSCPDAYYAGPGVWYSVVGSGTPMRVSACSFRGGVTVSMYSGPCSSLNCVATGAYNGLPVCSGREGSSLGFDSVAGEVYYLLVQSYYDEGAVFEILIDEAFPPENDQCSDAMGPIEPGSGVIYGSNVDAIFDGVFSCYAGSTSGGLWYKVIGTGQAMRADTCFDSTGHFDSELAVYDGTCGSLRCLSSNDDSCGLSSAVTWPTMPGEEYFVRVNGLGTSVGEFWLDITAFDPAENDVCSTSLPVFPDDPVVGTVAGATQDMVPYCDPYHYEEYGEDDRDVYLGNAGAGVWYYIDVNEDSGLTASTCSPSTSIYGAVRVFGGSCDSLSCVAAPTREDYSCGSEYPGSIATWFGEAGQRYFVLVADYAESGGDFGLTISTFEPIENDMCEGAFRLAVDIVEQGTLDGSTAFGEYNATGSCGYYYSQPGVWYEIEGIGGPMRVSACAFDTDLSLSVHNGPCDDLGCLAVGNYNNRCTMYAGSSVTWNSVAGEVYYILVQSYQHSGTFELSVEEVFPPDNDECSAAVGPIQADAGVVFGSTVDAIFDNVFSCYLGSDSAGLWYSVVGDGQLMQADTCSGLTNHDTEIAVYKGDCDALQCLHSNDDSCGVSSSVTWQTTEGETYLIRVNGYGSNVGDFGLTIRSIEPVENQECATRLPLAPGESVIQRLDILTHEEPVPFCFASQGYLGVWYEVIGTGNVLSVSTCSENTFADTVVAVYQGTCGALQCVPGAEQREYCINYFRGGSVTWPSEGGLSYKVFVGSRYYGGDYDEPGYMDDDFQYGDDAVREEDENHGRRAEEQHEDIPYDVGFGFGPQIEVSIFEFTQSSGACGEDNPFVEIDGPSVAGSIFDDFFGIVDDACFRAFRPGAWYRVESPVDLVVRASTCGGISDFFTGISVMRGTECGLLSCVDASGPFEGFSAGCGEAGAVVEWAVEGDASYYILVHGEYEQRGLFSLSVTSLTPPANDECQGAFPLSIGSSTSASLVNATSVGENAASCADWSAPGTWYAVTGSGNPLRVSACFFDVGISLSAYSGPCTSLSCINSGSYMYNLGACMGFEGASVSWNSDSDEVYYILLQRTFGNEDGTVELLVEEVSPPDNDDCLDAVDVEPGSELIFGSTVDAISNAFVDEDYSCLRGSPSAGLWYRVIGTGQAMRADTCFDTSGSFDPEIAVFDGTCSELNCIGSNDDSCGLSSAITWSTIEGVEYFIRVKSLGTSPVEFWLNVTAFDPAENDLCPMGLPLFSGDSMIGSMNGATPEMVPYCNDYFYNGVGVWYHVDGSNASLRLSTCSSATPYLTFAQVFSGSCDILSCVSASTIQDFFCGNGFPGSVASWFGETGQRYYILITTENEGAGGYFELSLSEFDAADNDACVGAEALSIDGMPAGGSTRDATSDTLAPCRYSEGPGVWYSIIGNGQVVNVTTCSEELNFDAVMTVSVGDCSGPQECIFFAAYNEPNCYSSFYSASTATWRADEGVTYYILVQGNGSTEVGEFVLSVTSLETPDNDECFQAIPINVDGTLITGSTVGATYNPALSYCSGFQSPDLWYSIAGTGSEVTASTCNSVTNYDSALSVYTSFDGTCREIGCETYNDDACGSTTSEVTWFAAPGLTYFIRVHGYGSGAGNFGLRVSGDASGDHCATAITAIPFSAYSGSTAGASADGLVSRCGDATAVVANGVWYSVMGTGFPLVASTCEGANFDTQISVFVGFGCNDLDCVDGNDQHCGDQSLVEFETISGVPYYILVHGYLDDAGDFTLSIYSNDDVATMYPTIGPSEWAAVEPAEEGDEYQKYEATDVLVLGDNGE
eukprot:CAMPEP_0117085010 /NCGR_PEP_ID=MMETSP0472-20121206/59804_1 /TAXON_ID=693140 ORGANISM="Tiarina fusus, Strain LIS" /NCGR_SAMPLE_ID=MMETSP0472 /ASSEMBLY_ACC=CAM_ASM_000603 /LENGTH=2345 /DNA_ID=CAMNT_0004814179 /DNA_START=233 /DNA_END=7270 /DNA_ORIENTATION=-